MINKFIGIVLLSALMGVLIFISSPIDCFDTDYNLSANLVGELTLTDDELERLHTSMDWCLENGYEPESISNFQIKIK